MLNYQYIILSLINKNSPTSFVNCSSSLRGTEVETLPLHFPEEKKYFRDFDLLHGLEAHPPMIRNAKICNSTKDLVHANIKTLEDL